MKKVPAAYKQLWAGIGIVVTTGVGGACKLEVDAYFSDYCVIQQGVAGRIFGQGTPDAQVEVRFRGKRYQEKVTAKGKWSINWGPFKPGGPDSLTVFSGKEKLRIREVRVGDVWICLGQSNMAFTLAPTPPWTEGVPDFEKEIVEVEEGGLSLMTMPRFVYHCPWERMEGLWQKANPSSVRHYSAVAWYMGKRLRELQPDMPLGIIVSAIGSTGIQSWMCSPESEIQKEIFRREEKGFRQAVMNYTASFRKALEEGLKPPNQGPILRKGYLFEPSSCFNAIVSPLTPYPIAGWVWYQGEADASRFETYADKLKSMIGDYRKKWSQRDSPFIVVQLPGFNLEEPNQQANWAYLREEQRKVVLETSRTGLVVTLDVGDPERIHPREKEPVGVRCAEIAHALLYGREQGPELIPLKATSEAQGSLAVHFTRALCEGGLVIREGFTIELVYADQIIQTHEARISDGTLKIASPIEGDKPLEVRYAMVNDPSPTLFLRNGSPLAPFCLPVEN